MRRIGPYRCLPLPTCTRGTPVRTRCGGCGEEKVHWPALKPAIGWQRIEGRYYCSRCAAEARELAQVKMLRGAR